MDFVTSIGIAYYAGLEHQSILMQSYLALNSITNCFTILQVSGSFQNLSTNDVVMNSRFKISSFFCKLENATRLCLANGSWAPKANYSNCKPILPIIPILPGGSEVGAV